MARKRLRDLLTAAETMTGYKGRTAHALPLEAVQAIWQHYHSAGP